MTEENTPDAIETIETEPVPQALAVVAPVEADKKPSKTPRSRSLTPTEEANMRVFGRKEG